MNNRVVLLIFVATLAMAVVYGYPGKQMDAMEGGAINMTDMDPHGNMTGGPMEHRPEMGSGEKKPSRKRRDTSEDIKNAGHNAIGTVDSVGNAAVDKAGELVKGGTDHIKDAQAAIKMEADDLPNKLENGGH